MPDIVSELKRKGLSDHYILIILRLRGFPVHYNDAVDELLLDLDLSHNQANQSPELLLLYELLKDPSDTSTKNKWKKPSDSHLGVPIFSTSNIFSVNWVSTIIQTLLAFGNIKTIPIQI